MIEMGTPAQVAEALHTTEASLAQMRYRGDGPPFVRAPRRRVLYRWSDVEQWIRDSLRTRTNETAPCSDDPSDRHEVGGQTSPNRVARLTKQAEMGQGRTSS